MKIEDIKRATLKSWLRSMLRCLMMRSVRCILSKTRSMWFISSCIQIKSNQI